MIDITNVEVTGWEAAVRGMRNPMNSWNKSDTEFFDTDWYGDITVPHKMEEPDIGPADHDLMMKLAKAGSDHRKYLRMIHVSADIDAPFYWWKEFDTYKVGTVANSCSTMHKIHANVFTLDDFSHEHLEEDFFLDGLKETIKLLNYARDLYIKSLGEKDSAWTKHYWWQMIQLLPTSYNQLRTVDLNYEVLRNIYFARRVHKLDEWHTFCEWIETLPYHEIITEVE